MQDKVDLIYKMMRYLGLSIDDLIVFDRSIDLTGKFPLEVYFSDKTRSFDVKRAFDSDDRTPIGIIIDNTVFTLGNYHNLLFASEIDDFCKSYFLPQSVAHWIKNNALTTLENKSFFYLCLRCIYAKTSLFV